MSVGLFYNSVLRKIDTTFSDYYKLTNVKLIKCILCSFCCGCSTDSFLKISVPVFASGRETQNLFLSEGVPGVFSVFKFVLCVYTLENFDEEICWEVSRRSEDERDIDFPLTLANSYFVPKFARTAYCKSQMPQSSAWEQNPDSRAAWLGGLGEVQMNWKLIISNR